MKDFLHVPLHKFDSGRNAFDLKMYIWNSSSYQSLFPLSRVEFERPLGDRQRVTHIDVDIVVFVVVPFLI